MMETRKITVVSTKTQKKSVINSSAETLGDLKADLRTAGIDYDGMSFFEGLSKTEIMDDSSILPKDVPFKGETTNELVFMLTNTNKKIKSGSMSRAEVYQIIQENNLQEDAKESFGKNYTICKTTDLVDFISQALKTTNSTSSLKEENIAQGTPCVCNNSNEDLLKMKKEIEFLKVSIVSLKSVIENLIYNLYDDPELTAACYDFIDRINEIQIDTPIKESFKSAEVDNSPYNSSEIDDMFDFL